MKNQFFSAIATALSIAAMNVQMVHAADLAPYLNPNQPLEIRVEDLLSRLTLEEKISIIHADSKFSTAVIPRLGIPKRWLSDGPHGVREDVGPDTWQPAGHTDDFSTAMPAGICLAATWNGGESSEIKAFYEITPLQGLINRVGQRANITFSEGYRTNGDASLTENAVAAAKSADVVIFIGGLNHDPGFDCEGSDRIDLKLPYGQDELIQKIVTANPRTIVVLDGTMVEMNSWLNKIPALLQAWYPGMEGGNALAGILFGDVNPSGKLPATFPKKLSDSPAQVLGAYPGTNGTVTYMEGLLVGYRWFDTKNIEPEFPFGFGLSYTTFAYSNLKLVESTGTNGPLVTAQFEIKNTGDVAGAEVA